MDEVLIVRRGWLAACAASLLFAPLTACTLDVCTEEPPSMELEVTLDDDLDVAVRSFDVQIEWDDQRFMRHFVAGDALGDGLTSIGIVFDPAPTDEVGVSVEAFGHEGEAASSAVIAYGRERFELEPHGCNLQRVQLGELEDDEP